MGFTQHLSVSVFWSILMSFITPRPPLLKIVGY